MKAGRKPLTPGELRARGTTRPDRRRSAPVAAVSSEIKPPKWLTAAGRAEWPAILRHVSSLGMASACDTAALATLANMLGVCGQMWSEGRVPPAAHLAELRKLQEMFGLLSPRSRMNAKPPAAEASPFAKLIRRT